MGATLAAQTITSYDNASLFAHVQAPAETDKPTILIMTTHLRFIGHVPNPWSRAPRMRAGKRNPPLTGRLSAGTALYDDAERSTPRIRAGTGEPQPEL
jgi:hypothetical protein